MKTLKKNVLAKKGFIVPRPETKISDKKYEHVLNVWNVFEMETMKDYHELYLKCELLFLPDVFEKFRNSGLKNYGLCLTHYLSAIWKKLCMKRFRILT